MKNIYLLGATGSIGEQTLDIIEKQRDDFKLIGISGYSNFDKLVEITRKFLPEIVVVKDKFDKEKLVKLFPTIKVEFGRQGLKTLATYHKEDQDAYLINALVGMVGLEPTIEAIKIERDILLANKETLVVGGHLVSLLKKQYQFKLYPIDSEHNALWQLMNHENTKDIKRLIITASGGSFRGLSRDELKNVSVSDALKHPNWSMGNKITIDSATMMNKGFEVIEACYLFDLDIDKVDTVIHKESMVHSLVEFNDGSILAHVSHPDMHLPISYAMNYPNRKVTHIKPFDLMLLNNVSFQTMDLERYPCLNFAINAFKIGGSMRTVLNAANEAAVDLFLSGKIKFLDIETIIEEAMRKHQVIDFPSLEEIYELDSTIKEEIYKKFR
ncbi:1-deoxy-D-xylulose-5-phosphate reductoisomerase [Mycoplasmatota bacterium]|nr:1-deoxy-D-xylulose-5-phosphate reductoisomerase [Mycoplasmatota bacterium]